LNQSHNIIAAQPPSFYNDDIERYKAKFLKTIEKRKQYKRQVEKVFKSMEGATGGDLHDQESLWHINQSQIRNINTNATSKFKTPQTTMKKKTKRLPSRQSGANFTNLDFDYRGNSQEILHLLKIRENSGSPNVSQLRFELGLRSYMNMNKSPEKEGEEGATNMKPMWKYIPSVKNQIPETVPPIKKKRGRGIASEE
jgi:hypothetical protein